MVPLANRRALARISSDPRALLAAMRGADSVAYCFVHASRGHVFSRGMLPWAGYEDPATGSAGGSLAAYLVRHGKLRVGERLSIAQGFEMGRPSRIEAVVEDQRGKLVPRVSGAAIVITEGYIEA
jgi:trans-2,3-dihydro-3-hydroxyanthranilate isomerase